MVFERVDYVVGELSHVRVYNLWLLVLAKVLFEVLGVLLFKHYDFSGVWVRLLLVLGGRGDMRDLLTCVATVVHLVRVA